MGFKNWRKSFQEVAFALCLVFLMASLVFGSFSAVSCTFASNGFDHDNIRRDGIQ